MECLKHLLLIDSLGILSLLSALNCINSDKPEKSLKYLLIKKITVKSIKQKLVNSEESTLQICDIKTALKLALGNISSNQLGNNVSDGFESVKNDGDISNFKLNVPGTRGCHEVTNNKTGKKILEEFGTSLCRDCRSDLTLEKGSLLEKIFTRHELGNSIANYLSLKDIVDIALDCDNTLKEIALQYFSKSLFVLAASSIKSVEAEESAAYILFCIQHDGKIDSVSVSKHLKNIFQVAFEKDLYLNNLLKEIALTGPTYSKCNVKPIFVSPKNTNLIYVVLFLSFTEMVFDDHKALVQDLFTFLKKKNNLQLCNSTKDVFSVLFNKNMEYST